MALDYRKCAQEISDNIGGGANVVSAAHCATRLRLVIADNGKVNKEALENVDGVKGMFESNGTGTVNKVYDEFLSITGASAASKEEVKAAAAAKQPLYIRLLKPIGDVFVTGSRSWIWSRTPRLLICPLSSRSPRQEFSAATSSSALS